MLLLLRTKRTRSEFVAHSVAMARNWGSPSLPLETLLPNGDIGAGAGAIAELPAVHRARSLFDGLLSALHRPVTPGEDVLMFSSVLERVSKWTLALSPAGLAHREVFQVWKLVGAGKVLAQTSKAVSIAGAVIGAVAEISSLIEIHVQRKRKRNHIATQKKKVRNTMKEATGKAQHDEQLSFQNFLDDHLYGPLLRETQNVLTSIHQGRERLANIKAISDRCGQLIAEVHSTAK